MLGKMMQQMDCGMNFDEFKTVGHFALDQQPLNFWAELKFDTPSGRIEIASDGAEEMGLPRVPQPWADDEPVTDQLRLITPASKWRLNDSYANDPHIIERAGEASVRLNPGDAARLGLSDGDNVVVSNDEGQVSLIARVDDAVLAGTAVSYKGRWPSRETTDQNVNFLHQGQMADMGESTSVHSTVVSVNPA